MAEEKPETVGGTPYEGRLKPGSERGGIVRQRTPQIDAPSKGDFLKLQKQALSVSKFMGHDPELWRVEEVGNVGQIRCKNCQCVAGFALYPMAGKDQINGDLVESRCEYQE